MSVCPFIDVPFDHLDKGGSTGFFPVKVNVSSSQLTYTLRGDHLRLSCSTNFPPIDLATVDNSCLNNEYYDPYVFFKANPFRVWHHSASPPLAFGDLVTWRWAAIVAF